MRNRLLSGRMWSASYYMSNGTESGGKSVHWPRIMRQSIFYGGWQHNYNCQQLQASRPSNDWSTSLDVYGVE